MLPTKLVAASVAGAAFGAGALALGPSLAADGSGHQAPQSSQAQRKHTPHRDHGGHGAHGGWSHRLGLARARARHVLHAEWTTRDEVRHEAIRGTVEVVSPRSVTVRAEDGVTRTFVVSATTRVRLLGDHHRGQDSISEVKSGDRALVVGKGAHQAVRVLARTPRTGS